LFDAGSRVGLLKTALNSDLRPRDGASATSAFVRALEEETMATGSVKWFNVQKGFGFIQPSGGGKDVFVHISAVERAGLSALNEGQHLEFELEENRGKTSAVNLKVK
jgi:CspA family cold shock protein